MQLGVARALVQGKTKAQRQGQGQGQGHGTHGFGSCVSGRLQAGDSIGMSAEHAELKSGLQAFRLVVQMPGAALPTQYDVSSSSSYASCCC